MYFFPQRLWYTNVQHYPRSPNFLGCRMLLFPLQQFLQMAFITWTPILAKGSPLQCKFWYYLDQNQRCEFYLTDQSHLVQQDCIYQGEKSSHCHKDPSYTVRKYDLLRHQCHNVFRMEKCLYWYLNHKLWLMRSHHYQKNKTNQGKLYDTTACSFNLFLLKQNMKTILNSEWRK